MRYIKIPNAPQNRVTVAAVSENETKIIAALNKEGIEIVKVKAIDTLPKQISAHSDMQMLHLGNGNILVAKEADGVAKELTKIGFTVGILLTKLGKQYPNDIALNLLILNNYCFGLLSELTLHIKEYCIHAGIEIVNSKQGYARCSVAVVEKKAAITSDTTLYKLLLSANIDTLLIGTGDILLSGYDTGFIGGCCGLISERRLAFTGNLHCYKYGMEVIEFLKRHNIEPVYLTDGKLIDIGGILPLMEAD